MQVVSQSRKELNVNILYLKPVKSKKHINQRQTLSVWRCFVSSEGDSPISQQIHPNTDSNALKQHAQNKRMKFDKVETFEYLTYKGAASTRLFPDDVV